MEDILIQCLASNYLAKKFNQTIENPTDLETILAEAKSNQRFKLGNKWISIDKIIVITGAGLSSEAGFPLGWDTAQDLMDDLVEQKLVTREYLNYKIEELKLKNDQKSVDFETILEVLSEHKNLEKRVKEKLAELFELRNHPVLGYEVLAHWLRHCVIDGIINFNFDELLDEAIEEEFVHSEYIKVIGGRDYADRRLNTRAFKNNNYPIYIKPHGTISDKDSLRATRDHYLRSTTGFQDVLKKLLKGNILFLAVGYNMQSIELNQLFKDQMSLPGNSDEEDEESLKPNFFLLKEKAPEHTGFSIIDEKVEWLKPEYFSKDFGSIFLNRMNTVLIEKLNVDSRTRFKNSTPFNIRRNNLNRPKVSPLKVYPLKDILRHEITCELFSSNLDHIKNEKDNKYPIHVYNYVRMLVDLGILLAKSGGVINIFALNSGRFGRLYKKYYSTSIEKITLVEICNKLGLTRASYTSELWTILPVVDGSLSPDYQKVKAQKEEGHTSFWRKHFNSEFEAAIGKYETKLIEHLAGEIRNLIGDEKKNKAFMEIQLKLLDKLTLRLSGLNFSKKLLRFASESSYEIGHPFKSGTHLVYQEDVIKKIHSWHHLRFEFYRLVKDHFVLDSKMPENGKTTYQILYCTTHGRYFGLEWLIKNIQSLNEKLKERINFKILLRDLPESHFYFGLLKDKDIIGDNFSVHFMNWWTNNRNLIILLKKEEGVNDFIPQGAIYFYRGSTTRRVSPISISLETDNIHKDENLEARKTEHLNVYHNIFKKYEEKSENREILKKQKTI